MSIGRLCLHCYILLLRPLCFPLFSVGFLEKKQAAAAVLCPSLSPSLSPTFDRIEFFWSRERINKKNSDLHHHSPANEPIVPKVCVVVLIAIVAAQTQLNLFLSEIAWQIFPCSSAAAGLEIVQFSAGHEINFNKLRFFGWYFGQLWPCQRRRRRWRRWRR